MLERSCGESEKGSKGEVANLATGKEVMRSRMSMARRGFKADCERLPTLQCTAPLHTVVAFYRRCKIGTRSLTCLFSLPLPSTFPTSANPGPTFPLPLSLSFDTLWPQVQRGEAPSALTPAPCLRPNDALTHSTVASSVNVCPFKSFPCSIIWQHFGAFTKLNPIHVTMFSASTVYDSWLTLCCLISLLLRT